MGLWASCQRMRKPRIRNLRAGSSRSRQLRTGSQGPRAHPADIVDAAAKGAKVKAGNSAPERGPASLAPSLLAAADAVLAVAGGIWWAWDANPTIGQTLLLGAVAIAVAWFWITREPRQLPRWSVVIAAVLVLVIAGYAIWAAIGTIVAQSTIYVG